MIMADVFKILFPVIGTLMSIVCFWLLFEGIFPAAVGRCKRAYEQHPIRALLLGIAIAGPGMAVGFGFLNAGDPVAQFLGFAVLFLLIALGLLGSAGLSRLIGVRLPSVNDEAQPWKRVLRGGVILSITFLFPFLGWFLVLPVTLVTGVGAAVMALWRRKRAATPAGTAEMGAASA